VRLHFPDRLSVKRNDKVQQPMRGWVLLSQVYHQVTLFCCGYFFDHIMIIVLSINDFFR
jgi:hypothetical protein